MRFLKKKFEKTAGEVGIPNGAEFKIHAEGTDERAALAELEKIMEKKIWQSRQRLFSIHRIIVREQEDLQNHWFSGR